MNKNDIPAFPQPFTKDDQGQFHCPIDKSLHLAGMTLRDYLAGQSLIALDDPKEDWFQDKDPLDKANLRSIWAYQQADAMLLERDK